MSTEGSAEELCGSRSLGEISLGGGEGPNRHGDGVCEVRHRIRAGGLVLRRGLAVAKAAGDGCDSGIDPELEVLLVSRRRAPSLYTVPAGKYEPNRDGDSVEACALRETREEAGVESEAVFDLGWYSGTSKDGRDLRTKFFALRYVSDLPNWEEEAERKRSWLPIDEARDVVAYSPVLAKLFEHLERKLYQRRVPGASVDCILQRRPCSPGVESMSSDGMDDDGASGSSPVGGNRKRCQCRAALSEAEAPKIGQSCSASASIRPPSRKRSRHQAFQTEETDCERFGFYRNQVGGHICLVKPSPGSSRISVRPLKRAFGEEAILDVLAQTVVLKPLNEKELEFYAEVVQKAPAFERYMPRAFGTKTLTQRQVSAMSREVDQILMEDTILRRSAEAVDAESQETSWESRMRSHYYKKYIVLEDLAESMVKPRILDLKMGYKQRSKTHSTCKRERCRKKSVNSTSHQLGFRVCGLFTEESFHDKYWGRRLPLAQVQDTLAGFFLHRQSNAEDRRRMLSDLLERLRDLRETISGMSHWRLWNTSLLFLFDGDAPTRPPVMRIIDFAHCARVGNASPDLEFLSSLRNLEAFLEAMHSGHAFGAWPSQLRLEEPPPEHVQDAEELESFGDSA